MARYAKIDRRIWNDARFNSLCERGKLVFLFLLTHPNLTMLGAMRANEAGLAADLGISSEAFAKAFREVLAEGIAEHDGKASFLWLPNFLRYNKPESPNVVKAWHDAFDLLPECNLKCQLFDRLKDFIKGLSEGFREAFTEAFPEGYAKAVTVTETVAEKNLSSNPSDSDGVHEGASLFFPEGGRNGSCTGLGLTPSSVEKENLERAVESGWHYFLQKTGRRATQYMFTKDRRIMGRNGFEALITFARKSGHENPLATACELFQLAVDRLSESDFHAGKNGSGKPYQDWHHLFRSKDFPTPRKLLEFWLDDARWPCN